MYFYNRPEWQSNHLIATTFSLKFSERTWKMFCEIFRSNLQIPLNIFHTFFNIKIFFSKRNVWKYVHSCTVEIKLYCIFTNSVTFLVTYFLLSYLFQHQFHFSKFLNYFTTYWYWHWHIFTPPLWRIDIWLYKSTYFWQIVLAWLQNYFNPLCT